MTYSVLVVLLTLFTLALVSENGDATHSVNIIFCTHTVIRVHATRASGDWYSDLLNGKYAVCLRKGCRVLPCCHNSPRYWHNLRHILEPTAIFRIDYAELLHIAGDTVERSGHIVPVVARIESHLITATYFIDDIENIDRAIRIRDYLTRIQSQDNREAAR